ncbi:MAG: rhomboid family intramembrane serine protease [Deltaproteobacteria bacterium]|jgi:rhomboid protease GluP|nr:rhomboid family intramembrane serine protease [Deltaproteobacteria bacterium]MBT4525033.1 rhomboid family intramembrane serine protease [Deltaproteobacteria bacterium]
MHIYQAFEYTIIELSGYRALKEIELLLWSQNIPYSKQLKGTPTLIFHNSQAEQALSEIHFYYQENRNWPPPKMRPISNHLPTNALIVNSLILFLLVLFHFQSMAILFRQAILKYGRFSAAEVLAGDWYRLFTAQTLHSDDAHLFSNVVSLFLFLALTTPALGYGLTWLTILLGGALGNLINAIFYQTGHYSIGASTAVFSAIGIFSVIGIKEKIMVHKGLKSIYVPLIGALGLFAMLGSNPNSDVFAHLFGLISGIFIGILCLPMIHSKIKKNHLLQFILLFGFLIIIFLSWASLPIK